MRKKEGTSETAIPLDYMDVKNGVYMNGFIIVVFNTIFKLVEKVSAVEYFKKAITFFFKRRIQNDFEKERALKNIAIDIFMVLKWIILIFFIIRGISSNLAKVFVIYLLVMNIHTYFYNHVWSERTIKAKVRNIEHVQRRLISLLLSISYNIASYMYLYGIGFKTYFHVEANC